MRGSHRQTGLFRRQGRSPRTRFHETKGAKARARLLFLWSRLAAECAGPQGFLATSPTRTRLGGRAAVPRRTYRYLDAPLSCPHARHCITSRTAGAAGKRVSPILANHLPRAMTASLRQQILKRTDLSPAERRAAPDVHAHSDCHLRGPARIPATPVAPRSIAGPLRPVPARAHSLLRRALTQGLIGQPAANLRASVQ